MLMPELECWAALFRNETAFGSLTSTEFLSKGRVRLRFPPSPFKSASDMPYAATVALINRSEGDE